MAKINPLLPTLQYADPKYIAAAVLEVFLYNQKVEGISGFDPRVVNWTQFSDLRKDMHRRARDAWCRQTKKDYTYFPYSEDYVCRLYHRITLRTDAELALWIKELKVNNATVEP